MLFGFNLSETNGFLSITTCLYHTHVATDTHSYTRRHTQTPARSPDEMTARSVWEWKKKKIIVTATFEMYIVTSVHGRAVTYVNQTDCTLWFEKYVRFVLV